MIWLCAFALLAIALREHDLGRVPGAFVWLVTESGDVDSVARGFFDT